MFIKHLPENLMIQNSKVSSFGNVDVNLSYNELLNDQRHANNFAYFLNNSCSYSEILNHYMNVYRDISKLDESEKEELEKKVINFIKNDFNKIIIKG